MHTCYSEHNSKYAHLAHSEKNDTTIVYSVKRYENENKNLLESSFDTKMLYFHVSLILNNICYA